VTTQTFNRVVAVLNTKTAVAVVLLLAGLLGLPLGYTRTIVDLYEGAPVAALVVEAPPAPAAPAAEPSAVAVEDTDSGTLAPTDAISGGLAE
jgi:hypothetical protein